MAATPMTAEDIIDRARYALRDVVADAYQWTDNEMFDWLEDGQREILRARPDMYITDAGLQHDGVATPDPGTVTATGDAINITPVGCPLLVQYVMAQCLAKDTAAGSMPLSVGHMQMFRERLRT